MQLRVFLSLLLTLLVVQPARGDEEQSQLAKVEEPYIELHTGPGRGYPVFYIAERGEWVEILKRKTDWFKVRTHRKQEGWVYIDEMRNTLDPLGEHWSFKKSDLEHFSNRTWEFGVMGGDFDGARRVSAYGSFAFSPSLAAELDAGQVLGDFSDSWLFNAKLVAQPFPEWRYSPFFALGAGYINTSPHTPFAQAADRDDFLAHVGAGLRIYLTRRFLIRAEYNRYTIFTSSDNNEEINEWKLGFGFFF